GHLHGLGRWHDPQLFAVGPDQADRRDSDLVIDARPAVRLHVAVAVTGGGADTSISLGNWLGAHKDPTNAPSAHPAGHGEGAEGPPPCHNTLYQPCPNEGRWFVKTYDLGG